MPAARRSCAQLGHWVRASFTSARAVARDARHFAGAGWRAGSYVLVVPGGGTRHPGADEAVAHFMAAARALAARGVDTVYVGPTAGTGTGAVDAEPHWHPLGPVPQ